MATAKPKDETATASDAGAGPSDADATAGGVKVKLAHHYGEKVPGDEITVPRAEAQSLINAGFTTIDPSDRQAVYKALNGK